MKKIIVIGCPGSGKTTFAKRLCEAVDLPLFHLDAIWHKPDKTNISREEFDARLGELLSREAWIIDGNYGRTLERRLAACDTVMLFDLPTELCIDGVRARIGQKRPDMPWIESEIDEEFMALIAGFREQQRPKIMALLDRYRAEKEIVIFHSREEADEFLRKIETKSSR